MVIGWTIAALVTLLGGNLALSLAVFRRLDRATPSPRPNAAWPQISVLIPARDEAANIATCLTSLLAQVYPKLEILVLDDESTDDTPTIVTALAARDPRLRLITGTALPPGWLGKCHACAQLAEAAIGDYLLFTDADTIHGPRSVANTLALMEDGHLGSLSALPRQRAGSFAEQLLMPLLPLNILMLLPVGLVARRPEPSLSAGIGQFLAFRRATYRQIGGHQAVHDQVLDDVVLARRVKANGWRMDLVDGADAVQCRMYSSFPAIWQGFSKNQFDFYGRAPITALLAAAAQIALFTAPPLIACTLFFLHRPAPEILPWLGATGIGSGMRLAIAARLGARGTRLRDTGAWLGAILQGAAAIVQAGITLNSIRWGLTGRLHWKGRAYPGARERMHRAPPLQHR